MTEDEVRGFCVEQNLVITNNTIHMPYEKFVKIMVSTEGNLDEQKNLLLHLNTLIERKKKLDDVDVATSVQCH